jgi:hypothetical protein
MFKLVINFGAKGKDLIANIFLETKNLYYKTVDKNCIGKRLICNFKQPKTHAMQ